MIVSEPFFFHLFVFLHVQYLSTKVREDNPYFGILRIDKLFSCFFLLYFWN